MNKEHPNIGGQAVLEGVMMRGREKWVVSVRTPNQEIVSTQRSVPPWGINYPLLRLPFLRGTLALAEALFLAVQALSFSAKESSEEEIEITSKEMAVSVALGFFFALILFFAFPVWLAKSLNSLIQVGASSWGKTILLNLLEGFLRITVFLVYLYSISRLKDIRRVFEYHGAEHKTIHAFEAGEELTPEKVAKYGTEHVRCGTSFLLVVMVISIFVFSLLGRPSSIFIRIALRLVVLPVVAGISYEVIKFAGRHEDSKLVRIIMSPGLILQQLTTREPSSDQIEVAIHSLEKLLVLEGGRQKTEDRGQRTEDREQRAEGRGQRTEDDPLRDKGDQRDQKD